MRGWKSCGFVLVGAALTAGLPGCGGGSGGPTGPVIPTPAPCSHSTLLQGSAALPANVADFESFTTTATGRLDLTVDWTFSSSLIGLFVAQAPCEFDQFKAGTCRFLLQMASPPEAAEGFGVQPGRRHLRGHHRKRQRGPRVGVGVGDPEQLDLPRGVVVHQPECRSRP